MDGMDGMDGMNYRIRKIMRTIIKEAKDYDDDDTITFYASLAFELLVGVLVHVPPEIGDVLLRKLVADVKKEAAEVEMIAAKDNMQ